ncbi:MAG: signal peptidase I [Candidatus Kariarchaeaceae archaeon]|jgi:signal peptidase I
MKIKKDYFEYAYFGFFILFLVLFFTGTLGRSTGLTLVVIENADPNSMFPTYYQGDLFLIEKGDPQDYKLGDVVVYETIGLNGVIEKVIHRIIDIIIDDGVYYFRLKGDNPRSNVKPDQVEGLYLIPFDKVLGKIILRMPYLGHLSLAMQRNSGVKLMVYAMAAILAIAIVFWPDEEEEEGEKFFTLTKDTSKEFFTKILLIPKSMFNRLTKSRRKSRYLGGVGLILFLIIVPTVLPNFLPTEYTADDVGVFDVQTTNTKVDINDTLDGTDFKGRFFQARVFIYDNAGFWVNIKGFTLDVLTDSNDAESRISRTTWTSTHDFKGTIVIGGSIVIDEADIPTTVTTLYIVVRLEIRNFLKTEYQDFSTDMNFTP